MARALVVAAMILAATTPRLVAMDASDLPGAPASAMSSTLIQVRQFCASGPPQAAAIAIVNCHPDPAQALLCYQELLQRHMPSARLLALAGIAQLGPMAAPAAARISPLIDPSQSIAVRSAALAALVALAPSAPAVAATLVCMNDHRLPRRARADAARLLAGWKAGAHGAQTSLLALVDDPDDDLAGAAVATLVAIAAVSPPSGSTPCDALVPGGSLTTQIAALARALCAPADAATCARLRQLALYDPRRGLRIMAWMMLSQAGGGDAATVAAWIQLCQSREPFLQDLAQRALRGDVARGLPGPGSDSSVVQVLAAAVAGDEPLAACNAAITLRRLGPRAALAAPALWVALERPHSDVEQLALTLAALAALGPRPRSEQERLALLLDPSNPVYAGRRHDQAEAIQAMLFATQAAIGVPDRARRWVLSALANPDASIPSAFAGAALAVTSEGADGRYAISSLMLALQPGFVDAALDPATIPSLLRGGHGPAADPATLPARALSARVLAIRALGAIGPAAWAALPALGAIALQGLPSSGNSTLLQSSAQAAVRRIAAN